MRVVMATIVAVLSLSAVARAQEDVLKYGDTTGFFGQGRAGRHYEYTCPHCHQGFWIPTGSHSEASAWVANHKKGMHGVGAGAGPAGGGGGSLEDAANRAMTEGIIRRDGQLFMMGAGAHLLNSLMSNLFSSPSGPSAAEVEREREFRAAEERRRLEEIARREEMERRARIVRAAGFREEWDRRDAEMTQALDGVFDLVRNHRQTPFFGDGAREPGAIPEPTDAPPAAPEPFVPPPIYSSDVVLLGSDRMMVSPGLLEAGRVRAAETRRFDEGLSRWSVSTDPRTVPSSPRLEALKTIGGLMVDDLKDELIGRIPVPGLSTAFTTFSAMTDRPVEFIERLGSIDLRDPGEAKKWENASEELGRDLLRDAWGDPSRRQEKYYEAFEQALTGVRR